MSSLRDRAKKLNSLLCLLEGLEGYVTTVELRNENSVRGTVEFVDAAMNLTMNNVTFVDIEGRKTNFCNFYVQGKNIRFVHIPDEIDMLQAIQHKVGRVRTGTIGRSERIPRQARLTSQQKKELRKQKLLRKTQELVNRLGQLRNQSGTT